MLARLPALHSGDWAAGGGWAAHSAADLSRSLGERPLLELAASSHPPSNSSIESSIPRYQKAYASRIGALANASGSSILSADTSAARATDSKKEPADQTCVAYLFAASAAKRGRLLDA